MSAYETIEVDREDGGVVLVTLNRPDKLNALNEKLLTELGAAVREVTGDATTRVVIVTGAGEKAFAAGADIAAMSAMTPIEAKRFAMIGHEVGEAIEKSHVPFLAAVNGFALGGGCELALACDFVYASDKARLGQPEVGLGVIPGFGGTQRLARRVGVAMARELVYTGKMIGADEALRIGLVNAVVPQTELMPKVRDVAKAIATKGPLAIAAAKRTILRGEDVSLAVANELEATAFSMLFGTHDQREGMSAFLAKRTPKFEAK